MSAADHSLSAWSARILVAAVFLFSVLPLAVMLMMSFSSSEFVRFPPPSFSLRWYENYFTRTDWIESTLRSLWIGATVTAIAVLLGVPASLGIAKLGQRSADAALALATLPIVLPPVVIAVAMYMTFSSVGLVGTRTGIVLGHLTLAIPFVVLTTLASLRRLDPELVRAALSLGASRTRVTFTVTLPIIRPGILAGALFAFLASFDELMISLFVGNPEIRTLPRRMWEGVRSEFDPTVSAASAVVILATLVVVGFAFAVNALARRRRPSIREQTHV
ncbi:MAG: ABC transporter permease [Rhizobiaceae bacterium]|nr:ABC transporter permease [Rhizobiaceae bacterium]